MTLRVVTVFCAGLCGATLPSFAESYPATPDALPGARSGLAVVEQWRLTTFGDNIGSSGLSVADLDGDGRDEIIATAKPDLGATSQYWYILAPDGAEYEIVWSSDYYRTNLRWLIVVDVMGDELPEIIAVVGRNLFVHDGASRALLRTIEITTVPGELAVADLDQDQDMEIVVANQDGLFIYDFTTAELEFSSPSYAGGKMAVGNIDNDAALEVIISSQGPRRGYVIDGASHQLDWERPNGFGSMVVTGDVDGDQMDEIVILKLTGEISVFDGDTHLIKYSIEPDFGVDEILITDVEQDGLAELVYADDQWGDIHICAAESGAQLTSFPNPDWGVTRIAIGNTDDDVANELVYGTLDNHERIYVLDTQTWQREWRSPELNGPFTALGGGDVDNDGRPELLLGSRFSESRHGDGRYLLYDALSNELEYKSPQASQWDWHGLWRVATANVDSDPQSEIFVAASITHSGIIRCYDSISHQEQWSMTAVPWLFFHSLAAADIDLDGRIELVCGVHRVAQSALPAQLYVLDAETGTIKWTSDAYFGATGEPDTQLLRLANVDADPQMEIVAATWTGPILIVDGLTQQVQLEVDGADLTAIDTADADGNGIDEIYYGDAEGHLGTIDASAGSREPIFNFGTRIDGLRVGDFVDQPGLDYVFCIDGQLTICNDQLPDPVLFQGSFMGDDAGSADSVFVQDVDWDGHLEVVVNAGLSGVRVFELLTTRCLGDLNGDRRVGADDLATLLSGYGSKGAAYQDGDLDGDGLVSLADLGALIGSFGIDCD